MSQLIECVPNFSEGQNPEIIAAIANQIRSVAGVKLLHLDPGKAANRTVITFAGSPEPVVEAAFLAITKAAELIDMSKQKGEHPRIGATDVCPLVPISGISLEETAEYAKKLGKRVGEKLGIPVFLYEAAQKNKKRSNLSIIRIGEYEGMFKKIKQPEWQPDYGPAENSVKSGATVIGARDFLVAYNVNINSKSVETAQNIANEVRESGYLNEQKERVPGMLKSVKAIGWFIKEYNAAQVSMNLTNIAITPVHIAFEAVCQTAEKHGVKVTGSELIGLIPLKAMQEAGAYYFKKQGITAINNEQEIIQAAIKGLGLNELSPFVPEERIIEYILKQK